MKTVHPNSLAAFDQGSEELFSKRQRKVMEALRASREPLTDREIMIRLGFPDANSVRPRVTELLGMGELIEVDSVRCPITGKTVRRVKLANHEIQAEFDIEEVMTPEVVAAFNQHSA